MAIDAQRIMDFTTLMNYIWVSALLISVSFILLWQQLGPASVAGVVIMILIMPLNGVIATKMRSIQMKLLKAKDKRIKMINEVLTGIKVLKLYAWENSFMEQIKKYRQGEIARLLKSAYYMAGMVFSFSCAPFVVSLGSFATFLLISEDNVLDANKAFVSLSLFNIMRAPMGFLPMAITHCTMVNTKYKNFSKL